MRRSRHRPDLISASSAGSFRACEKIEMKNPIAFLRTIALIEGASFLVLLFLAMPLKYILGWPQAVRVVGMAHGVLFVIFCLSLLQTWIVARWPIGRAALIFGASIVPFGPWLIDRRMKNYEAEFFHGPLASTQGPNHSSGLKMGAPPAQPAE